jgi:hypothetical protein
MNQFLYLLVFLMIGRLLEAFLYGCIHGIGIRKALFLDGLVTIR